jgi:hypothetical protein
MHKTSKTGRRKVIRENQSGAKDNNRYSPEQSWFVLIAYMLTLYNTLNHIWFANENAIFLKKKLQL